MRVHANGYSTIRLVVSVFSPQIPVTRYVCTACGYIESVVESLEDRKRLKENYDGPATE